ncbi:hypothetical protein ACFE04_008717 [Oxalis oulophora]
MEKCQVILPRMNAKTANFVIQERIEYGEPQWIDNMLYIATSIIKNLYLHSSLFYAISLMPTDAAPAPFMLLDPVVSLISHSLHRSVLHLPTCVRLSGILRHV